MGAIDEACDSVFTFMLVSELQAQQASFVLYMSSVEKHTWFAYYVLVWRRAAHSCRARGVLWMFIDCGLIDCGKSGRVVFFLFVCLFVCFFEWAEVTTYIDVVERVELHEVMQLLEGQVGILEVEGGVRCVGVIEDVKVGKLLVLLCLSGNAWRVEDIGGGQNSLHWEKEVFSHLKTVRKKIIQPTARL